MTYMEKYQLWLEQVPENSPVHQELLALAGQDKELRERFGEDLTFGTAGLRGIMGAGTDRMNVYDGSACCTGLWAVYQGFRTARHLRDCLRYPE